MHGETFFEEIPAEVTPAPSAGEAPAPEAGTPAEVTPPGETPVTTPEDKNDKQYVPLERFQEVNNKLKENADELTKIKESLATIGNPAEEEVDINPETAKILDGYLKTKGYVSKGELEQERMQAQAQTDLGTIKSQYKLSDDDLDRVREQAVKNGAANFDGLDAAYKQVFMDKIIEDKVKEALAGGGATATAEKPGPGTGGTAPAAETEVKGATAQERMKSRIQNAISNASK